MDEAKAIQVSQQTREIVETGAQAMIQQAIQYLQDAVNLPKIKRECEELRKQVSELQDTIGKTEYARQEALALRAESEKALAAEKNTSNIIAAHRDSLLSETAAMQAKFNKLRHSMDTMRGIMESNLAA